jgi:hypothetical protein
MQRLTANEFALIKVFCSDYQFSIPTYQRPYAWRSAQALQLLDDLEGALTRDEEDPYFLGSIVLVKQQDEAPSEVIDGQQRLTTLTILLAVLRDRTADAELSAELGEMIREPGSKVQNLDPQPRLTLRQRDSEFFRVNVQAPSTIGELVSKDAADLANDAQRAIKENVEALDSRLAKWTEEKRVDLVQLLANRTFLVVVSTPDLASAYRIFSVMNARGLDLSPADIFKSRVIGDIGDASEQAEEAAAKRWEDAEEELGREDFADLFLHIRMIFAKERGRKELLREFPEQVLNRYLPGKGQQFVDDVLVPYAKQYATIKMHDYQSATGADPINNWFKRLDQVDNNDWRPSAMWALKAHENDPVWLDCFLRALERLTASMFIRRVYTTPRVNRFAEVLNQLDEGQGADASALQLSEDERTETLDRLDRDIYLFPRLRRPILLRLDEALANEPGVTYDHSVITVEHVLPQTPKTGSKWLEDYTSDQRSEWTHRLANLVLLNRRKNSEAQNYDFVEKKAMYFGGNNGVATFALTSQVLNEAEWTPEVLDARQAMLLAILRKEWSL